MKSASEMAAITRAEPPYLLNILVPPDTTTFYSISICRGNQIAFVVKGARPIKALLFDMS
jgi:hypothetical protein